MKGLQARKHFGGIVDILRQFEVNSYSKQTEAIPAALICGKERRESEKATVKSSDSCNQSERKYDNSSIFEDNLCCLKLKEKRRRDKPNLPGTSWWKDSL